MSITPRMFPLHPGLSSRHGTAQRTAQATPVACPPRSARLARAHGGELTVEAPPVGPGARFMLRLPMAQVPRAPTSSP